MDENKTHQDIYDTCKRHMHSYVLVETTDGFQTDGIITGLDEENVYLAVPIEEVQQNIPESGQQVTPNQFGGGYPLYIRLSRVRKRFTIWKRLWSGIST